MVEMTIYGVSFDLVGKQPIVLLKTASGNKYLPIWIGQPEAAAILMKLQGATAQGPIFAADDVIEESAIEMEGDEVNEEEIVDEFRRFLDRVSAEDFAEVEVEEEAVEVDADD